MLIVYRSVILVASIVLLLLLTTQLFFTVNRMVQNINQGSQTDSGIFPKRSRNVNAWYLSPAQDSSTAAYPIVFQQTASGIGTAYKANMPARIGIPKTSMCPIFRAQDDGSTDPLLIG